MTPNQITLVRQGFAQIAPRAEAVGLAFYQRLFTADPALRPLFRSDIAVQVRHLMTALTMVVRSLDDLTPILATVRTLGRRHVGYGVEARHFTTVGSALLAALEAEMGVTFTAEMRAAWAAAYGVLADAMIAAMDEAVVEPV